MQSFKDKVVWITGASSGYGKAMAESFAKAGAKLILSARREDELEALAKKLGNAVALPLDLAQLSTFEVKAQKAISAFGHVDLLINNGAIAQSAAALKTTLEVERHIMDVDYFSYTELTRCILPHMLERKSGQIAVVSGLLAHIHLPGRSTYAAAKAALIAYFGCLRTELVGQGIHISVLIPGAMKTDLTNKAILASGKPNPSVAQAVIAGATVEEAATQTLQALADKRTQAYIGLEDDSYDFWKLTQTEPEKGIQMLLKRVRGL